MGDLFAALTLLPALVLTFLVPGLFLSFAVFPRPMPVAEGPVARLGLAALLSLLVNGALALTLAVVGWLYTPVLLGGQATVIAGGLAVARSRGWSRSPLSTPAMPARPALALGALLTFAVLGAVWAPELRIIQRDRMPTSGVTWYYWDLADQIARNHSLPEESLEWARARPYPTTYLFFSATTAGYEQLTNADVRAEMEAFRLALLAVALVLAWLALRVVLSRLPAALVLLFLFGGFFFLNRFSAYRPESFGITLCLGGAWLLLARVLGAEREGDQPVGHGHPTPRAAGFSAVAVLAFAGAYLSHAIPLTAIALWFILTLAAVTPARRGRWRSLLLPVVPVAIGALVVGVAVTFAIDQEFPLARAAAPGGEVAGRDLTWQIILATEGTGEYRDPPDFETMLDRAAREPWARLDLVERPYLLLVFLLPFLAWRVWTPCERGVALGALGFALALGLLSVSFYVLYDTYVPQRTGPDRLAPYGALALAPLAGLGVTGIARAASRWRRAAAYPAAGLALVVLGGLLFIPTARDFVRRLDRQAIRPDAYAEMEALDASLPATAVIMTNAYTDGSVNGILHRLGLTNGRVPFQAVPAFRDETISLMDRTRRFLADPSSEPALLGEYGVTHILLANRTWALGGSALWPVNDAALIALPGVRFIRKSDNFVLYEVTGTTRPAVVPDTDRRDAAPWLALAWVAAAVVVWGVAHGPPIQRDRNGAQPAR